MPTLIGMFFYLAGCQDVSRDSLTIAASANMQYAMEELIARFTEESGIPCELIVGSSGKLTAQIAEGAPFDLFFSADMKYPEEIHNRGLTSGPPRIYAYGYLVFWSLEEGLELTKEGMLSDRVSHIAIANPETAPYGRAAEDLLKGMGVYESVESKLVFGESVAQTNQFILSGTAELGLTARSVVSAPGAKGKGQWKEADQALYEPIAQGVVHLKNPDPEKKRWALEFDVFLRSQTAMDILHKFGYGLEKKE
jgi:molybdate transport system substrate-binding protein